jgi:hypothetical protein
MNEQAQRAVIGWVSDPGHSWLAVNLDSEDGFPDAERFASQYSYMDYAGNNFCGVVYLEEDCDAPAFIRKYNLDGRAWPTQELPEDSQFRDLPRGEALTQAQQFIDDHVKIIAVN